MRKILLAVLICLLLVGCQKKQEEGFHYNDFLGEIEIGSSSSQVVDLLGEPETYYAHGGGALRGDLPESYFMDYEGFQIVIANYLVSEIRILSSDFQYDDLYIGQAMDET